MALLFTYHTSDHTNSLLNFKSTIHLPHETRWFRHESQLSANRLYPLNNFASCIDNLERIAALWSKNIVERVGLEYYLLKELIIIIYLYYHGIRSAMHTALVTHDHTRDILLYKRKREMRRSPVMSSLDILVTFNESNFARYSITQRIMSDATDIDFTKKPSKSYWLTYIRCWSLIYLKRDKTFV